MVLKEVLEMVKQNGCPYTDSRHTGCSATLNGATLCERDSPIEHGYAQPGRVRVKLREALEILRALCETSAAVLSRTGRNPEWGHAL